MSELSLSDQLGRMELEDIEEGAKAAIEAMKKSLTNSYEHMIRVGHFLNAMKAKLPHGAWGPWLKEHFEDSQQWAHRLMVCAADRANLKSTLNLTTVTTIEQHYSMLMNTPEKQAKKAERQAKKLETPLKPLAPATPTPPVSVDTIRNENPPSQPERPEWLADPDELDRPEEDELQPLPRTNTHHTTDNRRTPDARETDRIGLVSPDDPRELQDGAWYVWSDDRNRLLPVTDEDILRRAYEIRDRRGARVQQVMPVIPWPPETAPVVEHAKDTTPVVEHKTASVSSKPGKVPTLSQLRSMVEQRADIGTHRHLWSEAMVKAVQEWASYKQSLAGKAKIRSLEQWGVALTRIENVVAAKGWPAVADMIEKAIANGWQGWEHETNDRKSRGVAGGRIYSQLEKAQVKYDPLPE